MRLVMQVAASVSAALGCETEVQWLNQPYGPTVNAASEVARVEAAAQRLGENRWLLLSEPSMGAEDFSFLASEP